LFRSILTRALPYQSVACAALATFGVLACSSPQDDSLADRTRDTGVKVLLVGIDGGSFKVIRPMLKKGQLPNIARLLREGAHGELKSEHPIRSPAIWTTIATGRNREDHGITLFTVKDPERADGFSLVSSFDRKTLALWEILSAAERRVGVLGWWATWPAEPVKGWIVSDRMTRSRWNEWSTSQQSSYLTYPESLSTRLSKFVVDPDHFPVHELPGLLDLSEVELSELLAAKAPTKNHWLSVFKFSYATQRSFEEMSFELLEAEQPDLAMIFLIANDPISHTFWHFFQPQYFQGVDPAKAARLGPTIPNFYEHNDAYLGRLRQVIDDDTVIMVVSDHGFAATGRTPTMHPVEEFEDAFNPELRDKMVFEEIAIGQPGDHHIMGIFMAAGGPILPGVQTKMSIYDIAPTILALQGMPVPEDMPGRVLTEIIDPNFLAKYPIEGISSYADFIERKPEKFELKGTEADEGILNMLRSLGYIE